ncbi:hypothetical protein ACWDTT_10430 [Streptosporangium sandarakinum]
MNTTSAAEQPLPWRTNVPRTPSADPLAGIKPFKVHPVNGKPTALYGIGALARVLNRKSDTVRGWEYNGWIPKPTANFKGLNPNDPFSAKHGRRRLYTRVQLLAIHRIAYEEGILQPHAVAIGSTNFVERVRKAFADIAAAEKADRLRRAGQS